jgi:serine/threonine-protein kinase
VVVHDLEADERVTVMEEVGSGIYSPSGHILYSSATGSVSAVPFDPERMEVTGPSFVLETGVWVSYWGCEAHYAVSEGGTFAFARGSAFENSILSWIDRSGEELGQIGAPLTLEAPRLSPDGTRIATYLASPTNADLYLIDVQTGEQRRITHDPAGEDNPVWSPDGRRLAYRLYGAGDSQSFEVIDIDGAGQPEVVYPRSQFWSRPSSWSPQGWLAFEQQHPERGRDILALRMDGSEEILTVAGTESYEYQARFSPEGDWIAYTSDETGQPEVYVVPFPELSWKQQISSNGGHSPRWSQAGDELFFARPGRGMFSARYSTEGRVFRWETPTFLFPLGVVGVSPDAQRFLVNRRNPDAWIREIHLVENWFQMVKEKEAGGG